MFRFIESSNDRAPFKRRERVKLESSECPYGCHLVITGVDNDVRWRTSHIISMEVYNNRLIVRTANSRYEFVPCNNQTMRVILD